MGERSRPREWPSLHEGLAASPSLSLSLVLAVVLLLALAVGCASDEERTQQEVQAYLQEGALDAGDEIAELGAPAVAPLIAALEHPNPRVRQRAAYALGKIGDPRARDPLFQAFLAQGFANVGSTRIALIALVELDHPHAVDAAVIANAKRLGGNTAFKVISEAGPAGRESFIRLLEHEDETVREQALRELLRGGFLDSLEADATRVAVSILLTDATWKQGMNRVTARDILAQLGPTAATALDALIQEDPAKLNGTALDYFSELANAEAATILVGYLDNGSRTMRYAVLEALLDLADKEPAAARAALASSLETLITGATDKSDPAVQLASAQALAFLGGPRALEGLLAGLSAYSGQATRTEFIDLLGEMGDPGAIPALLTLLRDEDEKIRRHVVIALANIDDPSVIDPLVTALADSEREVRETTAYHLNRMDARTLSPLLEAIPTGDVQTVAKAYLFYLVRGEPGSEAVLVEALRVYGTEEMCVDYLNSGHEPLEQAAKKWAQDNGYLISGLPSFDAPPRWSSGP